VNAMMRGPLSAAFEATTGKLKWEFKLLSPASAACYRSGRLAFGGTDEGNLFALDAAPGKPLWIRSSARTSEAFRVVRDRRQQYIAIGAGLNFVYGLRRYKCQGLKRKVESRCDLRSSVQVMAVSI